MASSVLMFQLGVATRLQQVDLIAELKKKQVSPQVREGKDGTIEDIITGRPTSLASALSHYAKLRTLSCAV